MSKNLGGRPPLSDDERRDIRLKLNINRGDLATLIEAKKEGEQPAATAYRRLFGDDEIEDDDAP